MENSASEISNESEKVEIEIPSWQRQRTAEQISRFILRREEFLNSQKIEL